MLIKLQNNLSFPETGQLTEISLCTLILFITAQASIPLHPVPITLQTLGIMIIGLCFSYKTALYSVLTYISLGVIGFPVFANLSGGYGIFLGPRGGYIFGFFIAVIAIHHTKQLLKTRYNQITCHSLSCMAGMLAIYIPGISWLSLYTGLSQAIMVGLLPFIIPGIIKISLLVTIIRCTNFTKN